MQLYSHISENKVSFFAGGIKQAKTTSNYTISAILSMIASDKYKTAVETLRSQTNESVKKVMKQNLDYVTWSGTFTKRNNEAIIKHSGIICIDFDHVENIDDVRNTLINDQYTLALFTSPGGNGFKTLVSINSKYHLDSYLQLEQYYAESYNLVIDKACKDVSRACFLSYDPDVFINKNAIEFSIVGKPVEDEVKAVPQYTAEKPAKLNDKELARIEYIIKQIETNKQDVTGEYNDWQRIAFAFSTLGEFGRSYFHRVSAFNAGYEPKLCDEKFDDAIKNRNRISTRNAFYQIVADYGIENKLPREVKEGVKAKDILPEEADEEEFNQFGFFEYKGQYWSMTSSGGKYAVSNFTMEILYHVKTGGEEAFRLIKIKNIHGYECVINMNTDDFVSLSSFKKLIARRGNYLWKGRDEDLTKLQDKLQREERATKLIDVLGFNPKGNFFAFGNGIIEINKTGETVQISEFKECDEYGIVRQGDVNYFIPSNSKMFEDKEDLFYNYKKFIYIKRDDLTLPQWFEMFEKVYGENGKVGFIYLVASLFSDIIYKQMNRRFPILNLYGLRGSGKGTFAESLLHLFGLPQEQIMLGGNTTQVGFMRTFAQFRNSIVWLDEFKNSLHPKIIEAIKNIYDRIGYKRGKKDHTFEVDYVPVQSACILSGQEMPTKEPALFTRVIMLVFKETTHNEQSRERMKRLVEQQNKGLSHLTVHLLQYSKDFELKFKDIHAAEVKEIYDAVKNDSVEERLINNYACLSATCKILLEREKLGFAHHGFRSLLVRNLTVQHSVLQGSDDTSKFWQVVESLFNQNLIREGYDFELADRKLYIRIQNVSPLYEKEMRMRNDANVLQKSTLLNYLEIDKSKYVTKTKRKFRDGSYTWCMVFNYVKLDINLIKQEVGQTADDVAAKYRDMGIDTSEDTNAAVQEKLTFETSNPTQITTTNDTPDDLPF